MNEKVSVIIAVDNRPDRLQNAVESVLNQTYANRELLVVDSRISDVVESTKKRGVDIKPVVQPNRGIAPARNAGIGSATGEYIAFLDVDDLWLPNKLAMQMDVLRARQDAAICFTQFDVQSSQNASKQVASTLSQFDHSFTSEELRFGETTARIFVAENTDRDIAALRFVEEHCIPVSTVVIRRNCLPYTGLFDPMLGNGASCDMWVKILRRFNAAEVASSLVTCLSRETSAKNVAESNAFDHAEIYAKYIQYGTASANQQLVEFAKTLQTRSNHATRCHGFA